MPPESKIDIIMTADKNNNEDIFEDQNDYGAQAEEILDPETVEEPTVDEDQDQEETSDEDEIATYKAELAKEKDKFLRLFAEFENYKRRTAKERSELFKTAGQDVMQSMLPVLDDFDRATDVIAKAKDKNLLKGVELINGKLIETLKAKGLVEMTVKNGDPFDAEIHEAITQIPAPKDSLKDKVVDVVEKGYKLGDRIIRFPKVVVGK